MGIATTKYVRKPMYVDAVQVTEDNFLEVRKWCQGEVNDKEGRAIKGINADPKQHHIKVRVHQPKTPRQQKAYVGDWVLYTEWGYKVYTSKSFERSFDLADNVIEIDGQSRGDLNEKRKAELGTAG